MCSAWLQIFAPYCGSGGRKKGPALPLSRRALSVFVPEGLDDRSQAIYCLECVEKESRPVGDGVILTFGLFIVRIVTRLSYPIIPYPTGRFPFSPDTRQ
jgi:hypothetical protein